MVKKFLAAAVVLLVMVSGAWAATGAVSNVYLWSCHYSMAGLSGGHSDYSQARFHRIFLEVKDYLIQHRMLSPDKAEGSITLSGGEYSFIDSDKVCKTVSGTTQTFEIGAEWNDDGGFDLIPRNENYNIQFVLGADNGLNGVNASYTINFPNTPSLELQETIPNFRTTQEQLDSFVPYVEYVYDGSNVTGLKWRVVKASDVLSPVSQDFDMRFRIMNVYKEGYDIFYSGSWIDIASGDIPEGTVSFDEPIAASELWCIAARLYTYEDENKPECYSWKFVNFGNPEPEVWMNHISQASLVNGRSDYSNAQFMGLVMDCYDDGTMAEAKYFTDEGRMNIPGGGYTLIADNNNDLIGTVEAGRDMSFRLKMTGDINSEYLEYDPVDDSGNMIRFAGGAETGLNGKTITFTFQPELNMNMQRVVPDFKSTSEQLDECVPYIELVSEDGYVTGVNFRYVKAQDTSTVVEPYYRAEIRIYEAYTSGQNVSDWTQHWDDHFDWANPKPVSELQRVSVRIRHYQDTTNPEVYQWYFYPSSSSGVSSSGGSGGCSSFPAIFALALALFLKKH